MMKANTTKTKRFVLPDNNDGISIGSDDIDDVVCLENKDVDGMATVGKVATGEKNYTISLYQ